MKKYFLLLLICLCFVPSGVVCASSVTDNGVSSTHWIDHGIISYKTDGTYYGKVDSTCLTSFSICIDSSDEANPCLFFVKTVNDGFYKYTLYGRGSTYSQQKTDTYYGCGSDGMDIVDSSTPEIYQLYSYPESNTRSIGYFDTSYGFSCSIPIFSGSDEEVASYVKNYLDNGDVSDADNSYDLLEPDQSDDVELPKNLRTYGNVFETAIREASLSGRKVSYNSMTVRWDAPDDFEPYSYDVKIQVTYSITNNSNLSATGRIPDLTKSYTTDPFMLITDYPYAWRGSYDLNTGKEIARGDNEPENVTINEDTLLKLSYSCDFENMFPRQLKIWVRNRKGNKCSNWVAVTSNASQPSGSDSHASVEDDDGNLVDDDNYNDTPVDNSDQKTYYDTDNFGPGSSDSPNFSLTSFYEYLKSGFGLLGDNGLISFFSSCFTYLPSGIWTLILSGFAAMIIIGLINFALKR